MPELPEVETVRRGIAPHLTGQVVAEVYEWDWRRQRNIELFAFLSVHGW